MEYLSLNLLIPPLDLAVNLMAEKKAITILLSEGRRHVYLERMDRYIDTFMIDLIDG